MVLSALLVASPVELAFAAERIAGPLAARIERVVDGDTLAVTTDVWLGITISTSVRVRGIDTPELRGACAREKLYAEAARAFVTEAVGDSVWISNIEADKYSGRVVADVTVLGGSDLATLLVHGGLATAYAGGARIGWCAEVLPQASFRQLRPGQLRSD